MKKRIISMLLTVLMVMSLFSGMTVSAHAVNGSTIEYTMAEGDYVLRICQKLGLNYYTCKDAIMRLNNINDSQWNKLAVGRVLILPASDADAIQISTGAKVTTTGAATTATTTGVTGTASTATATTYSSANGGTTARSADTLGYYLVPYTMSRGETVSGVCNNLGVNFNIFSSFIAQINGVSNWNKVRAGQTLLIPTTVCPSVGTSCYGVMIHKVVNKDTAYSIASANGINYNASKGLLEALNQTTNLASIQVGDNFFYPVPMTISVPGTSNAGSTSTTTTTTTVVDGTGTSTTTKTTTAQLYQLTSSMSSSDGRMIFYVNDQPVTAAPAGAKVVVATETESGKAIAGLTVKHSNGKADLHLTADSFIMPNCDVRVDASIKNGHDITIEANYSGKTIATVGGISVQSAVKGAAVQILSADPNYEIASVYVYYRKLVSSANKTPVTVSSSNAFVMPDMPVTVEVTLKPVSTYAFYVNDPANGSFFLQVNGSPATRAAKGTKVTVVASAMDGYEPRSIRVTDHATGTKTVSVFSNTFTMPAYDVDIEVLFGSEGNNILILPAQGGTVDAHEATSVAANTLTRTVSSATIGADVIYEAGTNNWVALEVTEDAGYKLDSFDIVRTADGLKVTTMKKYTTGGKDYYLFKMPKGGVTVTPVFVGDVKKTITANFYMNGAPLTAGDGYKEGSFSIILDGKKYEFLKTGDTLNGANNNVPYGSNLDLRYDCNEGVAFVKYIVKVAGTPNEELTNQANLHGYFQMPNQDVTIDVYFETGKVAIGPAAITGVGTVSYRNNTSGVSINSCDPDETVRIYVTPGNGYRFDYSRFENMLTVTRKDNGAPITITPVNPTYDGSGKLSGADYFTFKMPAEGADVACIFDPKPFIITMRCVDEVGHDLTGQNLWQIAVNGVIGVADNTSGATRVEVAYEDGIIVGLTEAGWSQYDMVSFRIDGHEYIADVVNYFYNFAMVDERAKDLEIIAVLRPRVPSSPTIYNLAANYDPTKGGVEFILLDKDPITGDPSATGYADLSGIGGTNYYATVNPTTKWITGATYTKNACAGDYVAILARSVDTKYEVKLGDISIVPYEGDADRIIPTQVTGWRVDGVPMTFYVFKMPASNLGITVNFAGIKRSLNIHVREMDGLTPVGGMIRLFTGTLYRDVASDWTFDDVAYGSQVQILRSELAISEGMKIASIDVRTPFDTVPYYDLSDYGEGVYFTMPDESVDVFIRVDKQTMSSMPVITWDNVVNGHLEFRSGPSYSSAPVDISNIKAGDVIYIFPIPDDGYAYLEEGELKVYVNGSLNAVNIEHLDVFNPANNIWVFTVQPGLSVFTAAFEEAAPSSFTTITLSGLAAGQTVYVSYGGGTWEYGNSATFNAPAGEIITVWPATEGYNGISMTSTVGLKVINDVANGVSLYQVNDGVGADTLNITLALTGSRIITESNIGVSPVITFTSGGSAMNPEDVAPGTPVTAEVHDSGNYTFKEAVVTDIDGNSTTYTANPFTFNMPAVGGDATLTVVYELKTVNVSFLGIAGTDSVKYRINDSETWNYADATTAFPIALHAGDVIHFESGTSGRTIMHATSTADTTTVLYANSYTVPGSVAALSLTFTFT